MTLNPETTADLVTREVQDGSRDGIPTRIVVAKRSYATDQADLWNAVTDIERIPRWFLPISGDLQVGGKYQLEGNASGVIEQCEAPKAFTVTWEFGGGMSWVHLELTPSAEGTTLVLSHEAPVDDVARAFWAQYGPGAVGVGWDLSLMGLGLHLESDATMDPNEVNDWATSPEGIAFVRHAATGWADAAISHGDSPEAAHSAAENTITFYTVPPDEPEA